MKFLKKINLLLLVVCLMFSASFFNVFVNATDKKIENEGATYRVEKVVEESYLGYGLTYSRSEAYTSIKNSSHAVSSPKDAGDSGNLLEFGKEYRQQVNLLEMTKDSEVQLIPYAYLSGSSWVKSTIRTAAEEFERENPGKKVIAAVNGDWFQIKFPQSASTGVTISNGEYFKNDTIHGTVNTLVFDNELVSGQRIYQIGDVAVKPMLAIYDEEGNIIKEFEMNKVNQEPGEGETSLYFATVPSEFQVVNSKVKVTNAYVIDRASKAVTTRAESFYGKGKITGYQSAFELGSGDFAIKTNNSTIAEYLKDGVTVRCQFEYKNELLSNVKNAIGFPYKVMVDGKAVYPDGSGYLLDAKTRKPRTFLGVREDGSVVFATVDGRQAKSQMYGMNLMEMAALMEYYGCVDSWKFDGGGSATMIIRKQSGFQVSASFKENTYNDWVVVNSPSDGSERSDGNCLLMVVDAPQLKLEIEDISHNYIVFNVVLLSDLGKYTELYVFINGEKYLVEDGKVRVDGIKSNVQYECYVYGKYGDEYYNLGTRMIIKGALLKPKELKIYVSVEEKNDSKYIKLTYNIDNDTAIKIIDIMVGEKRYSTSSKTLNIPCSTDLFKALTDLEVKVEVQISEFIEREVLIFDDVDVNYNFDYAMFEIDYTIKDAIENIFMN